MMPIREILGDVAGRLCKGLLPIRHEYYLGTGKAVGVCTLSSTNLLKKISTSDIMNTIAIAGRLLSENKGIDAIINFALEHPDLRWIIVCGEEVKGHRAGQALIALATNGVDTSGKIIGAHGPHPVLKSSACAIEAFRRQVQILDMIGIVNIDVISLALIT
jgi:tetrahydromethanopterin S-methyltransferase subunit A